MPDQPKRDPLSSAGYSSYVDTSGELGSKELSYGLWWVTHKADLYRLAVFSLGIFTAISWGYTLWKGAEYGWYAYSKERSLIAELRNFPNFTALYPRFSPTPLQIITTVVVPSGVNNYDILGEVANTNVWYIANFDYYFQVGSATTSVDHATLMPGEERPIASLGYTGGIPDGSSALVIKNIRWSRISNKQIRQPADFQSNRLQFQAADFTFTRAESNPGVSAHTIRFTLTNNSSFSYKNPHFYVGLYVGDTIVGIAPLELNDFRSLETRQIDLRSFVQNLNVTDIRVFPQINVYDQNVYLKPGE